MEGVCCGVAGGAEECVFVDVAVVRADVYAKVGRGFVGFGEGSKRVMGGLEVGGWLRRGKGKGEVGRGKWQKAYWIHRAVAEGPNHSPGCFPHAEAP